MELALPASVGATFGVDLRLGEPVRDVRVPDGIDVLLLRVEEEGGELLGGVTLPVFDRRVDALLIADAVAADLGWQILGRYFQRTTYPDGAVHNDIGWLTFLQELWGCPNGTESKFYKASWLSRMTVGRKVRAANGWLAVEVGPDLPRIRRTDGDVHVVVRIGGRPVGALTLSARRGVSPQELRAAISSRCGMELCVAAVREGLLLDARGSSLGERLRDAASRFDMVADAGPTLSRYRHGEIPSPVSRHAVLPSSAVALLGGSAPPARSTDAEPREQPMSIRYAPDRIEFLPESTPPATAAAVTAGTGRSTSRHEFESLFSTSSDPWRYDSQYERTKYDETLELLPADADVAIELGCASGHFTRRLAPRVKRLVAADISTLALAAARERCQGLDNIEYLQLDLGSEPVPGTYDLIVCSEMLYYAADRRTLPKLAAQLAGAIRPGGYILTAHANTVVDGGPLPAFDWDNVPFGAAYIGKVFERTASLQAVEEIRTPLYRIQLFRRAGQRRGLRGLHRPPRPVVQERELTARLRPQVAARVRWEPGEDIRPASRRATTTKSLPILMYHRVAESGSDALQRYRVSPDAFEGQLQYLRSAGFRGATLDEWAVARHANKPLDGRAVILTFDDAYTDFAEIAWPLLRRYEFPVSLFVPTAHVGGTNAWDERFGDTVPILDWDSLRELSAAGVEIGAHGCTHRPLPSLTPHAISDEAARSRAELEDGLGVRVTSVAYPYGQHDAVVTHLHGACGFLHGVTTVGRLSSLRDRALSLPRVEVRGDMDLAAFVRGLGGDS